MTRGLYPPETLSDKDIKTLQGLRRDIYSNALVGGFFGMGSGLLLHTSAQWARKLKLTKATFNRNTLMLSVLGGGALGMFLFAVSTGKQEVYKLHPIFQVGAVPQGELDYSKRQILAQQLDQITDKSETEYDMDHRKNVRAVRRRTMLDSMGKGRGFSDSHGGHWYHDEDVDMNKIKEIRAARRKTLSDNLTRGHGLSDSHGGHWTKE